MSNCDRTNLEISMAQTSAPRVVIHELPRALWISFLNIAVQGLVNTKYSLSFPLRRESIKIYVLRISFFAIHNSLIA
jgi:hypothetical protein